MEVHVRREAFGASGEVWVAERIGEACVCGVSPVASGASAAEAMARLASGGCGHIAVEEIVRIHTSSPASVEPPLRMAFTPSKPKRRRQPKSKPPAGSDLIDVLGRLAALPMWEIPGREPLPDDVSPSGSVWAEGVQEHAGFCRGSGNTWTAPTPRLDEYDWLMR